jgi:putative ATP-dependent endonuclease of OLD family
LSELDADDKRKLQDSVIESRGDILFAQAMILFEGQTEELALPIWAQKFWGSTIHELGFSFVRANGTDYFPFICLAKSLEIPWYLIADGEPKPVSRLEAALKRAGQEASAECPNVVVLPNGSNFEQQLLAEGYLSEIELALNEFHNSEGFLDGFIHQNHGLSYGKAKGNRDYISNGGRERAAIDAMKLNKLRIAKILARTITELTDPTRQFPSQIERLFQTVSKCHGLRKVET